MRPSSEARDGARRWRPQQVLRAGEAFVQDRRADGNARFRAFAFTVAPSETVTRRVVTVPSEGYDLPFQWDDPTGRGFGGMIE